MSQMSSYISYDDFKTTVEAAQAINRDNQRRTLTLNGDSELDVIEGNCDLAILMTSNRIKAKLADMDGLVKASNPDIVPVQIGVILTVFAVILIALGLWGVFAVSHSNSKVGVVAGMIFWLASLVAFGLGKSCRRALKEKILSELKHENEFSFADQHSSNLYPLYSRYLKSMSVGEDGIAFTSEPRLVGGDFPLIRNPVRPRDDFELGGYVRFDEISRFVGHPELNLLAVILKKRKDTSDRVMLIKNPTSTLRGFSGMTVGDLADWLSLQAGRELIPSN